MKTVLASLTWALALVAGLASGAVAQGLQTGVITGTITSNDGLSMPGATITVESPALQGTLSAVTDVNGIYVVRGLPPGEYVVTIEMDGMATAKRPTRVPLGRTVEVDVTMAPAAVAEQVTVRAEAAPVVTNPTIGANFNNDADRPAADRPHAVQHRRARARPHRQRPERRPGDDRGRVRLRQRLPDQRRRRQRQHLRHQPQPVHRGRHRGDAGAHLGHLGRIRPLLGRRRQRRHQARRRHLLGHLPPQPRATRRGPTRRRSRRASGPTATRTSSRARSAGRWSAPAPGSSAPAATRTRPRGGRSRRPASATTSASTTSATS